MGRFRQKYLPWQLTGQHSPHSTALSTGTASESGHVCHLLGRGFPKVTGCSDPGTPGSLPALAVMGLCVYIYLLFFLGRLHFQFPLALPAVVFLDDQKKNTENILLLGLEPLRSVRGLVCTLPQRQTWPRQQVLLIPWDPMTTGASCPVCQRNTSLTTVFMCTTMHIMEKRSENFFVVFAEKVKLRAS